MKTLYVHIGTPKTGTSAIQAFCQDNGEVLKKKGYCYPIMPYRYAHHSIKRNGVFLQEVIHRNGERLYDEENRRLKEGLEKVVKLFDEYDQVILSDEGIWRACYDRRKTLWQELKDVGDKHGFSVKIIVYLRRQDTWIESVWNQLIKGAGFKKSVPWDEFIENLEENRQLDYYSAVERIAKVLGKENVIVRRFDRNYFPNGLIQSDFLNALGLEMTDEYTLERETMNLRLSGNTQEIKRILNSLPNMNHTHNSYFRDVLGDYSDLSGDLYPSNMFSPEEARAFAMQYREGNRKIASEYLHEEDTDLFDMTFKDTPKWDRDNPYLLDDVIRFMGETNIHLLSEIDRLQTELNNQKRHFNDLKNKLRHPLRTVFHTILGK